MKLGENIFNLRKKQGLSQEQLGEKINVTRQTISNWELGETQPNPEQLKLLSKELKVSIDELLDNDVQAVLVEKISNTEKLAGLVLKVLKWIGILFIVFLIIDLIAFTFFVSVRKTSVVESSASTICYIEDTKYEIEFGTGKYFNCSNCSEKMNNEIKEIVDFDKMDKSMENINNYFIDHNGSCE